LVSQQRIDVRGASLIAAALICCSAKVRSDPQQDYVLNCMGCHQVDGAGQPPAIPNLQDRVGYFLTVPQGRAYLVQVPGAANSMLGDRELTGVLNWMVDEFAGASRPAKFEPFAVEEVAAYRRQRPADVDALRHALQADIARAHPGVEY
jgi:mono/diheme cytochrome c family protein